MQEPGVPHIALQPGKSFVARVIVTSAGALLGGTRPKFGPLFFDEFEKAGWTKKRSCFSGIEIDGNRWK